MMASDEKLSAKVSTAASEVASDIGSFIRTQRENAQVSLRQLAERSGVSNPYLSQVERGLRKPSADVLNQIAKALRVSAEVLYVQAGMLEPSDKGQVRDAIITDTAITERQKQVLLEIYASFTAQNDSGREEHSIESDPDPALTGCLDQRPLGYPDKGAESRVETPPQT
jgi:transcriptional regulator with XRE-family HTH domain